MTMEKKIWEQNIPCDAVLIRRLQKPAGRIAVRHVGLPFFSAIHSA